MRTSVESPAALTHLGLSEIASRLERASDFDSATRALATELKSVGVRVENPLERRPGERPKLVTLKEELAWGRSYDFLQRRARAAIEDLGLDAPDARSLLATGGPRSDLDRAVPGHEHALRCLDDLAAVREAYVARVGYLVGAIIDRYRGLGVDTDDLRQEGFVGLMRAVDGYDWRRGVRFATYAKYWIRERVLGALYDQSRTVRLPAWIQKLWQKMSRSEQTDTAAPQISERRRKRVIESRRAQISFEAGSSPDGDDRGMSERLADERLRPENLADDGSDLRGALARLVAALPGRESLVLRRRFGLGGGEPESLATIGSDLGLTAERIRQIQQAALAKLRDDSRVRPLLADLA